MATIAFDVYGTLIDTDGVVVADCASGSVHRRKRFRKPGAASSSSIRFEGEGLMRRYENFAVMHASERWIIAVPNTTFRFSEGQKDALLQSVSRVARVWRRPRE